MQEEQNEWMDGLNMKMSLILQVNYLSHLLLVLKLLPVMKESVTADARVIFVSSKMEARGEFTLDNIQGQLSYDRSKFYANSKLYMVRFDTIYYLNNYSIML